MVRKPWVALSSFLILNVLSVFCCSSAFSLGSGGFRNEVVDAEAAGKGFSFAAQADAPSAVQYNPAGLTQLKGSYVSLAYMVEAPRFECDSTATGNVVQMQKQTFFLPSMFYVSNFKSDNFTFGFGMTSPYGLGTDWASDSFARFQSEESDVVMKNFNPTVAYKVSDGLSIGAGLDYFTADVSKHKRIAASLSDNAGDFLLKGDDESWGYNFGLLLVSLNTKHRIGVSYRSEINLNYTGKVSLDNLNATGQGIFGGNSTYTTAMESKSTIPRSLAVGYAYKPNTKWTIETDVEWTGWSCVEEEVVRYPDEKNTLRLSTLSHEVPVSKDWRDVYAYGIGAEYKATDKLDLRCGFLYEQTPVPSANFETALPDSDKYGITLGLGYLFKDVQIDTSYAFLKYKDRDVTNDVGAASGANLDGKYRAYVNIVGVSFTYKY